MLVLISSTDNIGSSSGCSAATDPNSAPAITKPIKIKYHPNSGLADKYMSFNEYRQSTKAARPPTDAVPWLPFSTCADFEYVEIVLEAGLTAKQNNTLLNLIGRITSGKAKVTLQNNSDLEKVWERASNKLMAVCTSS